MLQVYPNAKGGIDFARVHRTVVRNAPYRRDGIGIRERHNERKNDSYSNPDVIANMSHRNLHYKQCDDTYLARLDEMLQQGVVSGRGLKPDAKVFGELVFDVNTEYFAQHGGYEYAKSFYQEAYRFAEQMIGQQYILSAILHADERNRSLSEQLGHDVYHYHLHVVYIPVVEKEIKWSKRCKDKSLVGTTKEIIHQISHSKKWAFVEIHDENGKMHRIPSYRILQDQFYEHIRDAGYGDVERGERGSDAQRLDVISFKTKQESERLGSLEGMVQAQQNNLNALEGRLERVQDIVSSIDEVEQMGERRDGKVILTGDEHTMLKELAKEGLASRSIIERLRYRADDLLINLSQARDAFDRLFEQTRDYRRAMKLAPKLVKEFFTDLFERTRTKKKNRDHDR
ncbi:plasmid recombination protein [Eubacteriales bacterium OttesenSCG-928-N14]|nr:plasmid recombination protein [Eubacteriales bacterium OttesenSCG-928-N14]